ncbi:MAG: hypothetical protein ABI477_02540 [Chryseolinea sp.]
MPETKNANEVDLFELLVKLVLSIKENFWLFVFAFSIGIALGVTHFYISQKTYEGKMILSSGILTDSYAKILFENASQYLVEGNYAKFADAFEISEADSRSVRDLRMQALSKVEDLKEHDRFQVTIEVSDKAILERMQVGIVHYLENNAFVKVRVAQLKAYLTQMVASTEKEIKALEDMKTSISTGVFFQSAKGNVMFDPTVVNSKILELIDKKIGYENSLRLSDSVQVIEGFTSFEQQKSPKLLVSLISGAGLGMIFILIIVCYKSIRVILTKADQMNSRAA